MIALERCVNVRAGAHESRRDGRDVNIVLGELWTHRIGQACEHTVIYIHRADKALSLSNWLTGGAQRLGDVDLKLFDPKEIAGLRGSQRTQFIEARVSNPGSMGHDYYHANPSVSSDLILLIRDKRRGDLDHRIAAVVGPADQPLFE